MATAIIWTIYHWCKNPYLGTSYMFYTPIRMASSGITLYPTSTRTSKYKMRATLWALRLLGLCRLAKTLAMRTPIATASHIQLPVLGVI